MGARSKPRTIRDISHFFISSPSERTATVERSSGATIWIASAEHSSSRALLAAGTAAAFARQAVQVSIFELADNLPNVGFYFGLEPKDYMATSLSRRRVVSGAWNGVVHFTYSRSVASLVREVRPAESSPHVTIIASTVSAEKIPDQAQSVVRIVKAFSRSTKRESLAPDVVILAVDDVLEDKVRIFLNAARSSFSNAMFILCTKGPARLTDVDECVVLTLRDAARRSPSEDPIFNQLAASILQRISSRRRRRNVANG